MTQLALIIGVVLGLALGKRPRALLMAAVLATFGLASSATAAYGPATADDVGKASLAISATGVTMLVAVFIPILTGLLTKITTSSLVKSLITLSANGIAALVTSAMLTDGSAVISWQTFVTWFVGFITSIGLYTGLWKPAGLTSSAIEVNGREVMGKLSSVGVK